MAGVPSLPDVVARLVIAEAQLAALKAALAALEDRVARNTARLDGADVVIPVPIPPRTAAERL